MQISVISIKPQYADAIYSGVKLFEFRKKPPTNLRDVYLLYESAPVSKLTGAVIFHSSFTVRAEAMVSYIMRLMRVGKSDAVRLMGISEKDLISYAGGPDNFVAALMISHACRDSRFETCRVRPPQNWGCVRVAGFPFAEFVAKKGD